MPSKKPSFEYLLANAFREEQRLGTTERPCDDTSKELHFLRLSIHDIQFAPIERLMPILSANSITLDFKVFSADHLRMQVLFEKFFHLHYYVVRSGRTCGFCLQLVHESKRCASCKQYRYCDRACQIKHWPIHKAFCSIKKNRDEQRDEKNLQILRDDPSIVEKAKRRAMNRVWDGKENDYFEKMLKIIPRSFEISPVYVAKFLATLPPTVVQAHGPIEFWKLASHVMDEIENTDFTHEVQAWASVLEYHFDPHWPESSAEAETYFLKPNVEVFVEYGGLERLTNLMLDNPASCESFTAVLSHLSRYREVLNQAIEEHIGTQVDAETHSDPMFVFSLLTKEIKHVIFHDFLGGSIPGVKDHLNFGRSCKAAAQIVCDVIDLSTTELMSKKGRGPDSFLEDFVRLSTIVQDRLQRDLGGLEVMKAAQYQPDLVLLPKCQQWVRKIDQLSQKFKNGFVALRSYACAYLMVRRQLHSRYNTSHPQLNGPKYPQLFLLYSCQHLMYLQRKWVEPYGRLTAWMQEQLQRQQEQGGAVGDDQN